MARIHYTQSNGGWVRGLTSLHPVPPRIVVDRSELENRRHDGVEVIEVAIMDGERVASVHLSFDVVNGVPVLKLAGLGNKPCTTITIPWVG